MNRTFPSMSHRHRTFTPREAPSRRSAFVRMEHIHRLLRAVPRTPTGTFRVSLRSLARELGVSRNTIIEDLELLELFNAPVAYDRGRRTYYYSQDFDLRPPVWLTSDEVLALLVATRLAARSRAFPVGHMLVRALDRTAPVLAGMASLRPGATTQGAPIASATATAALPKLPVAPLTSAVSPGRRLAATHPP